MTHEPRTLVEILTLDGCPHRAAALELVAEVVAREGVEADVRVVDVPDLEAARRLRFLGSPTIRVDGSDIEPGADDRTDYVHGCRLYRTDAGLGGRPSELWLVDALAPRGRGGSP
jgi:glutaredoxin